MTPGCKRLSRAHAPSYQNVPCKPGLRLTRRPSGDPCRDPARPGRILGAWGVDRRSRAVGRWLQVAGSPAVAGPAGL